MAVSLRLVLILASLLLLGGCSSPEDFVKVPVPREMRAVTGAPPEVTLTAFKDVRDDYEAKVKEKVAEKAEAAATLARTLTKTTRATTMRYADQVASLERQATAELQAINDTADEESAILASAMRAIELAATSTRDRSAKLEAQAQAKADSIRSIMNFGLSELLPGVAAQFPGVGLAIPALTMLGGLFMTKPGQAAKSKAAEDAAYDAGRREAIAAMREGAAAKAVAS